MSLQLIVALSFFISTCSSSSINFCISDTTDTLVGLFASCPAGSLPYRHAGANLFDIAWGVWAPPGSSFNVSTSLKSVRDAAASGVVVARFFAAPWSYLPSWGWLNMSTREEYWQSMDLVVHEATALHIKLIPSLGHGCGDSALPCNPSRLCIGEVYRDMIVNRSSCTYQMIKDYAQAFVHRYKSSPAILFWELGNELNLQFDGCSYDKSPGSFFTAAEGLTFLHAYADDIKSVDTTRPVNTGMSAPRLRARGLAATAGGGAVCVSAENPKGDCDGPCPAIPYDTLEDTRAVLAQYYGGGTGGFDMMSIHWYSCLPPNGNYSWCTGPANSTILPLQVFKAVADELSVPLYVGEYGPGNGNPWSASPMEGLPFISAMAELDIPLSTLWAFECPSHNDMAGACLHPGSVAAQPATFETLEVLQQVERVLTGLPPLNLTLDLTMLPLPREGHLDPACLDGSPYGYYLKKGLQPDKLVVTVEGGGWCPDPYNCWTRTQPSVAGGVFGSSKNWSTFSEGFDFGTRFAQWSQVYLPYCDGFSFSGSVLQPSAVPYGPHPPTLLYYRGAHNLQRAVEDALTQLGINSVSELLVSGGSAGGLSTLLHVDRMAVYTRATRVAAVPECGFFLFHNSTCIDAQPGSIWCNTTDQFKVAFSMHNATGTMAAECLAENIGQEWRCFMAPVAVTYVNAPLLFWQSKYDQAQLALFLGLSCASQQSYTPPWIPNVTCSSTDTAAIAAFGQAFMQQLGPVLAVPGPHRAVFLTSCVLHGMDYNFLSVQDTSVSVAVNLWYDALVGMAPTLANDYKWVEDLPLPRTDNPLACPPFTFEQP